MSAETKRLRAEVFARARGRCEACHGPIGESGHLDHQFGRAKVPQAIDNCWALCLKCDDNKTNNVPNAKHWFGRFLVHCAEYGYDVAMNKAAARLFVLRAKRQLPTVTVLRAERPTIESLQPIAPEDLPF